MALRIRSRIDPAICLARFRSNRRNALIGAVVSGALAQGVLFVFALINSIPARPPFKHPSFAPSGQLSTPLVPLLAVDLMMPCVPVFGYAVGRLVYTYFGRGRGLVLWLRRFRPKSMGAQQLERVVESATFGVGVPVTLQDESVSFSQRVGVSVLVAWAMLFWPIGAVLLTLLYDYADAGVASVVSIVGLVSLVAIARLATRLGYSRLGDLSWAKEAAHIVRRVRRQPAMAPGLAVFRVSRNDDHWKPLVCELIRNSDAVIFDTDEMTEALAFEFEAALALLPPEKLTLIMRNAEVIRKLSNKHGQEVIDRCQTMHYPGALGHRNRKEVVSELLSRIAANFADEPLRSPPSGEKLAADERECNECGTRLVSFFVGSCPVCGHSISTAINVQRT